MHEAYRDGRKNRRPAAFLVLISLGALVTAFHAAGLLSSPLTVAGYDITPLAFAALTAAPRPGGLECRSMKDAAANRLGYVLQGIAGLRYSVDEHGLEALPPPEPGSGGPGILFLCNHPSLIDAILIWLRLAGVKPRPLSDTAQMQGWVQRLVGRIVGAITIPNVARDGRNSAKAVRRALEMCGEALTRGDNVLLFPSGRASRDGREHLGSNSAAARLMSAAPGARVVLVRISGLWGSSFSYASDNKPIFMRCLLSGIVTVLGNLLLFAPRREVRMEFAEPDDLPRTDKTELNRYLETFFAEAETPLRAIRRFFWQRNTAV